MSKKGKRAKKRPTWRDLFDFVLAKCNPHYAGKRQQPERFRWTCHHNLGFTQEFLAKHPEVAWATVFNVLYETGGFCDCEIHWNSVRHFQKYEGDLDCQLPLLDESVKAPKFWQDRVRNRRSAKARRLAPRCIEKATRGKARTK